MLSSHEGETPFGPIDGWSNNEAPTDGRSGRERNRRWNHWFIVGRRQLRSRWALVAFGIALTGFAYTQEGVDFEDRDEASTSNESPAALSEALPAVPVVAPIVEPVVQNHDGGTDEPIFQSPEPTPLPDQEESVEYLRLDEDPDGADGDAVDAAIEYEGGPMPSSGFEPYSTKRFARDLDERITINLEVGYFYDSNINLSDRDKEGDSVFTADFSIVFNSINAGGGDRGFFYRAGYSTSAFSYSSSDSRNGRDPLEHLFNGAVGYRGGKTTITLGGNLGLRNGNGLEYTQIERETGRSDGEDYGVNLSVHRQLDHSSIEAMAGYQKSTYDGDSTFGEFGDDESVFGDVAWYYEPGWAPKTQLGVGVTGGYDEVDTHVGKQKYWAPSLRARHQLTAKTRFEGFVGTDIRDYNGAGTISSRETLTYGISAFWQATARTGFEAGFNRNVNPSITSFDESYEATNFELGMNTSLPANWFFNAHARFENADYFSNLVGGSAPRDDDYFAAGVSLSRMVKLTNTLSGTLSFFYDYRENDSTLGDLDYDQHISGVKFGLSF